MKLRGIAFQVKQLRQCRRHFRQNLLETSPSLSSSNINSQSPLNEDCGSFGWQIFERQETGGKDSAPRYVSSLRDKLFNRLQLVGVSWRHIKCWFDFELLKIKSIEIEARKEKNGK